MTTVATSKSRKTSFLNKNSAYIQSLVSFILDTKPYHCKLTETVEEYQFSDEMFVKIEERLNWRAKIDGVWKYNYFSSANPNFRTTPISRLYSPLFTQEEYIAGVDENQDLALVPFAYSKKTYDGPQIAGVKVVRNSDGSIDPLTETVDWFESKGSFEFMVRQIRNAKNQFDPLWQNTMDNNLMLEAIQTLRESALDTTNPKSNVNQIRAIMDDIRKTNDKNGKDPKIKAELDKIYVILDKPWLPNDYNDLFVAIEDNPVMAALYDIEELTAQLSFLSPRLFFGEYTDMNFREGGLIYFLPKKTTHLQVFNITPDYFAPSYDEWTITMNDAATQTYVVRGSMVGYAGKFVAGESFSLPGFIQFSTKKLGNAPDGFSFVLKPANKMLIHPSALMETWNLIRTNPLAHTRPYLVSAQYGAIYDLSNTRGKVTLKSSDIPSSTFTITLTSPTKFQITNPDMVNYKKTGTVGVKFDDGIIGFTIKAGTRPFSVGDKFYVGVLNKPAEVTDLTLSYGYDLDAYDNDHLLYPSGGRAIGFYYDTRFPSFEYHLMRLTIGENAKDGRNWRMTAIPNKARPVSTKKKDGSGPNANVDLQDATSGVAPDPAANAKPLYSMGGAHESDPDLTLYFADEFKLEFSDDGVNWSYVQNLNVEQTYNLPAHGLSFIIPSADRPYIASSSYEGSGQARVEQGDVFTFSITNPHPELIESPVALISAYAPRLEMHSSGFYYAPAANWTVEMTSDTAYRVSALYSSGDKIGTAVTGTPLTGVLPLPGTASREGHSFKGADVHFTFVPNNGLKKGDKFTFSTFERKPTYVVHGSVTGYSGTAVVGEYFWNGAIGFTIPKAVATVYDGNGDHKEEESQTLIRVDRIRDDIDAGVYTFTKSTGGYMVTHDVLGVKRFVKDKSVYEDDQIKITLLSNDLTPVIGNTGSFRVHITIGDLPLFAAPDLVVVNPIVKGMKPANGDTVVVTKTRDSHLNITISPDLNPNLNSLMPMSIDPRIIDVNINKEEILSLSPELALLRGFIPVSVTKKDSKSSVAEFYDPATIFEYTSAATGEKVGSAYRQNVIGGNPHEDVVFEWDTDFFGKYLPINSEANFITTSPGWVENVRAHITESAKFMIGSAGIDIEFEHEDAINVVTKEDLQWKLKNSYKETANTVIKDGPFKGFIPGFDNVNYDGDEKYDAGQPPDIYALLAKFDLSDEEKNDILQRWNFYLVNGNEIPSSAAQWKHFWKMLDVTDPNPGNITDQFGIPYVGAAFDIDATPDSSVGAKTDEATQVKIKERGTGYDDDPYDTTRLDTMGLQKLIMMPSKLPPYQNGPFTPGMPWDEYQVYLEGLLPARQIEIHYPSPPPANLIYRIWIEGAATPVLVPVVDKISDKQVGLYIAQEAKVKITITTT